MDMTDELYDVTIRRPIEFVCKRKTLILAMIASMIGVYWFYLKDNVDHNNKTFDGLVVSKEVHLRMTEQVVRFLQQYMLLKN